MESRLLKITEGSYREALSNSELINKHWVELESEKSILKVNIDFERYEMLENAGNLITVIAKRGDNVIGYSINVISTHLHHKDTLMCYNDLLFLEPESRQGTVGIKLITATEKLAKEKGVEVMFWHSKVNTPLSSILPRMGNTPYEQIFIKEL